MNENEQNIVPTGSPTPEGAQPPVETSPTTAPEAPGETEKAQAPSQGGVSAEVVQAPTNAPTEAVSEGQKPVKKGRKGLVIGIIATVVLAIGAGVAWIVLSNNGEEESGVADKSEAEKPEESVAEDTEDTEDTEALARRLYGYFDGLGSYSVFYAGELRPEYATDHTTRVGRIEVALQNLEAVKCKATLKNGGLAKRYGEDFANWRDDLLTSMSYCFDGAAARKKYKEIFGREIVFIGADSLAEVDERKGMDNPSEVPYPEDLDKRLISAIFSAYSPTYDEFYAVPSGSGGVFGLHREYVSSQRDGDNLYIFETAFRSSCDNRDGAGIYIATDVINHATQGAFFVQDFALPTDDETKNWNWEDWGEYYNNTCGEIAKDITNETTRFKWTFKKNAEGNWIFESVTRVE